MDRPESNYFDTSTVPGCVLVWFIREEGYSCENRRLSLAVTLYLVKLMVMCVEAVQC